MVAPIYPKPMPAILTTPGEVDLWLAAHAAKALELQRPLPDDALKIVASGGKEDKPPEAVLERPRGSFGNENLAMHNRGRLAQALRIDFPTERNQWPRLERDIQVIDDACRCELDVCRAATPFHRAFDHH